MIYLLIAVAIIFTHVLIIDLITSKRLSIYREIDNYNKYDTFEIVSFNEVKECLSNDANLVIRGNGYNHRCKASRYLFKDRGAFITCKLRYWIQNKGGNYMKAETVIGAIVSLFVASALLSTILETE